jgi:hypothetical protein
MEKLAHHRLMLVFDPDVPAVKSGVVRLYRATVVDPKHSTISGS